MDIPDTPKTESRKDRFRRVAEKRTLRILNEIRILGNCSNKSVYEYDDEEVSKIFGAIEEALRLTKLKFSGSQKIEFKL